MSSFFTKLLFGLSAYSIPLWKTMAKSKGRGTGAKQQKGRLNLTKAQKKVRGEKIAETMME